MGLCASQGDSGRRCLLSYTVTGSLSNQVGEQCRERQPVGTGGNSGAMFFLDRSNNMLKKIQITVKEYLEEDNEKSYGHEVFELTFPVPMSEQDWSAVHAVMATLQARTTEVM